MSSEERIAYRKGIECLMQEKSIRDDIEGAKYVQPTRTCPGEENLFSNLRTNLQFLSRSIWDDFAILHYEQTDTSHFSVREVVQPKDEFCIRHLLTSK